PILGFRNLLGPRRGAEGSFLCSLSSRFSGRGGGVGSLPRAWRRVGVPLPVPVWKSIEPRPPRPCEVGRPKGRRRKNRRQSHNFFLAPAAPSATTPRRWSPGESPAPAHRRNFKACFFRSNNLLATEGRETPTTLRAG